MPVMPWAFYWSALTAKVQKKAVEHWHPFSVQKCQHTLCNLHQPPLFQRWRPLVSLLFLAVWLTSRHFSLWSSWDWKCKGHSHVHLQSVLLKNRAGSVWRLALPGSSALRPAGLLCPSYTPTHTSSSIPSFLWPSAGWLSAAGGSLTLNHTETNHISVWLLNARWIKHFSVTEIKTQRWLF